MKKYWLELNHGFYTKVLSKIIFLFNSELMHTSLVRVGEVLGKEKIIRDFIKNLFAVKNPKLTQKISGINFENPIGLAAGFDYEARLTQILPSIGFGFGTVGTITNFPYEGNKKPRLARLLKSKSLIVNKGFKNDGIDMVVKKLKNYKYEVPVGLSIGQTNTDKFSQEDAIKDIISAFKIAEKANLDTSYYELNISCPNLASSVSFYPSENLNDLLVNVNKLKIKKPIFIKMPIHKSDKEVLGMLEVISKNKMSGVIFGNLQSARTAPLLDKEEIKKYPVGNFSGKATWANSNHLIELAFRNYKNKLVVIGCGGVFSAEDAYTKIKLGASLVQLVTGLIFEGPFLPAQINAELLDLIKKDGFKNVSEAIGKAY